MTKPEKGTTAVKSRTPKAGKAKAVTARRDPTTEEAEAIALATEAKAKRPARIRPPTPDVIYQGPNSIGISVPHTDAEGWGVQMLESLGVDSYAVVERLMTGASQTGAQKAVTNQEEAEASQNRNNKAVSFIASIEPKSTIEATLALQMLAAHEAAMLMSANLHNATTRDGLSDYSRMMNQTMRTFTAQVEALSKLRTGGKQQVEVRYVYVDARTQTVVNGGPGGGVPLENHQQPHGPGTVGLPFAPGVPVWGEDAGRDAVPIAGHQGTEAMPDARGPQPRGTEGIGERQLCLRAMDGRDHQGASDGPRVGEALSQDAE